MVVVNLVTLLTWGGIMTGIMATTGMPKSFEDSLKFARDSHWLFYTGSYVNMVLLTILGVMVWAGLYRLLRDDLGFWADAGFALVPIYAIIALFSYSSQLVIVPRLLADMSTAQSSGTSGTLLRYLLQIWPQSSLQYFDQFSYFILGITTFIFGVGLARRRGALRASGWLFTVGLPFTTAIGLGVLFGWTQVVSTTSLVAGVLSILAEVLLAIGLLRPEGARLKSPRQEPVALGASPT